MPTINQDTENIPFYIQNFLDQLNHIANNEAKIIESYNETWGYADYAEREYASGFATAEGHKIRITMEWQAEDKEDAEKTAFNLTKRISETTGEDIQFIVKPNIWGVSEGSWGVVCYTSIPLPTEIVIDYANSIANKYAKIETSPSKNVGYASYAETEYAVGFATEQDEGIHILMEWHAENKKTAEETAKLLTQEISYIFDRTIEFKAENNIWAICEDSWYVTIDKTIEFDMKSLKKILEHIAEKKKNMVKFELGTWMRLNINGKLFQANSNDVNFPESTLEQATIWKPKIGEWCWDKHMLVKVTSIREGVREDGLPIYSFAIPMYAESHSGPVTLQPFVGELPEWIKDFEKRKNLHS